MTENSAKPMGVATAKLVPVVVKANHHSISGPGADANMIAIVDSTSNAGDAGRKKSGFVITRVDKASNSSATILENESDFENELNDHGAYGQGGASSPGSSSILSETSTADGGSLERPLNMSRAPPSTPAGATPTSPAWPGQNQRPGGITAIITANSAVAGAAALLSAAANLGHQASSHAAHVQQAVVISSQSPSAAPPATINREASASSRFHIIKIETGPYKRGRWNCRDFDESASGSGSGAVRSDMIAVGGPRTGSSSNSSGRPSFHIIAEENGHGAGDHTLLLLAAASDHSTAGHQQTAQQQTGLASKPPLPTGHHHPHHPQQHSPLPATLPHSQQAKGADSQGTALPPSATPAAPSKGATISKQPSVTSSQPQPSPGPASATTNPTPLSNIAQHQPHQRSQSPVVVLPSTSAALAPSVAAPAPTPVSRFQVRPAAVDLNNAAAAILDSIVGSMHNDNNRIVIGAGRQQASAITSSTSGSTAAGGATAIASVVDGPIGGGSASMGQATPGSVGANVVAIDNKIEQAMDLVKTHLLYAVREEVEVLKEKIIDLEKKVFRLETENKLLREYAPPEILQQIQHQHHPQSQAGATNVNAMMTGPASSTPSSAPAMQQQTVLISQVQQQASQPTITQAAPPMTSQHSVQGLAMATVNTPITVVTTAPLSSTPVQQQPPH